MGWWRISTDTLAESRFVVSALAETTACLIALEKGTAAHPGEREWLDARLPAYRARLAGDPITALLVRSALRPRWIADFVTPTPTGEADLTFHEELAPQRDPALVPDALGALLGPARARVLVLLDTPKSTTQLVALTGQGLGSVGRHLKTLLAARLIRRRRAGRSVLYDRTPAGEVLVRVQAR